MTRTERSRLAKRQGFGSFWRGRKRPPITEEHRENLRKAHLGQPAWNKGKKTPESIREKQRAAKLGKKQSPEMVAKRRASLPRGPRHHAWKGITPLLRRLRASPEFRYWREEVYKRDNYTCQKCSVRGGTLHPHHIRNFATYERGRFDIKNGVTLCSEHHKAFHRKYGLTANTTAQIREFLAG